MTLENDSCDSVLDVAGDDLRRHILSEGMGGEGGGGWWRGGRGREIGDGS